MCAGNVILIHVKVFCTPVGVLQVEPVFPKKTQIDLRIACANLFFKKTLSRSLLKSCENVHKEIMQDFFQGSLTDV